MARATSVLSKLQPIIVPQVAAKHTASLIFLHGSGDTGDGVRSWLKLVHGSEFSFPHIRIIYPTAPVRPYTPNGGMPCNVWFDRQQISPAFAEDIDNVDEMCGCLDEIVAGEMANGISYNRIVVGGFSMGGAMALHYGYRFSTELAGVFALSCFLNDSSLVYDAVKSAAGVERLPPLFQAHGAKDPLVSPRWGASTHKTLRQLGVAGQYTVYPNLFHEMNHKEIEALSNWIWRMLPDELATTVH